MKEFIACLLVGAGGFFGSIARFLVARAAGAMFGVGFPWGTLIVNLTGAFLLGLAATLVSERFFRAGDMIRYVFAIGFLGAYTTFSTFEFESHALVQNGKWQFALANLVGSVILGYLALRLGILLARRMA